MASQARGGTLVGVIFIQALASPAAAHSGERGQVLLLPTHLYMLGGALTVVLSFIVLILNPKITAHHPPPKLVFPPLPHWLPLATSAMSFAALALLVAAGLFGSPDPLSNPLPLVVWTFWWVGFTALTALAGNLWLALNPWVGPYRLFLGRRPPLIYPDALGRMPALLLFAAFAWFELVFPTPQDPSRLAAALTLYALITFAGLAAFGLPWLERGEAFTVFFTIVARLSPLKWQARQDNGSLHLILHLGWPGRWLTEGKPLSAAGIAFVLFALSSVSFDGLSRTFAWIGWLGVNPLEFPGRSAVLVDNSVGLFLSFLVLSAAFLAALWLRRGAALTPSPPIEVWGRYVLTLVPIAIGFHFAHYLPNLLLDWRHALRALSDPFARGWDLLGASTIRPSSAMAFDHEAVTAIYNVQTAIVVLAHMMAVFAAHRLATADSASRRDLFLAQLPMAALMVGYTVYGLWLLSAPVIG